MVEKLRKDMKYNGTICGTLDVSGHVYDKVAINGDLSVSGDLDCNRLVVNGSFSDHGTLKAKDGTVNGEAIVKGGLDSDRLSINGNFELDGDALVKEIYIRGTTVMRGCILSDKIDLLGNVDVKNDCNSEFFTSKGAFVIGGLLNAGHIDINMSGNCQAKEIGGETIRIRRMPRALFDRVLRFIVPEFGGRLVTDTIEGDNIYIEYTSAKTVRGNNVKIGEGCDIGLVEYKKSFEHARSSQIKEQVKT